MADWLGWEPSQARPPEIQAWTAPELARFLRWADAQDPDLVLGWRLLGHRDAPR